MRRVLLLGSLILAVIGLGPATASADRYDRTGAYLDYGERPSLMNGFAGDLATYEIAPGARGIVEIWPSGARYFASVHDALYGLWHFTHYDLTGDRHGLAEAFRAARWLHRKQDSETGIYPVEYRFDIGGRPDDSDHIVLEPPWFGSNTQALPISLLTRLYRETGERKYLAQARAALRPLTMTKSKGGVQSEFLETGETFFEGYATLPISVHTLSHHVQTLVALHDMSDLSRSARRLFARGMRTLAVALPHYNLPDEGRTAAWLAHVTDPPRATSILNGYYQEFMVAQLRALNSVSPDPVVRRYRDEWDAQMAAICADSTENCFFHGAALP